MSLFLNTFRTYNIIIKRITRAFIIFQDLHINDANLVKLPNISIPQITFGM